VSAQVGTAFEVFRAFLRLGLTSFGGPIAHLGYFRDEFVARRKWLDERTYADLVATSAIRGPGDFALALAAFGLLAFWRVPPWLVVVLTAAGGAGLAAL
jgi:chromate transporter